MPTIQSGEPYGNFGRMIYLLPICDSGGMALKIGGNAILHRRLSGAVGRSRFGHKTQFRERHSASDCHQTHITVHANFKWPVTAQRLLIQSNVREVITPGHWIARTIGA